MRVLCAILAGGNSRRMGRDKAWVKYDGIPMLERVAHAASQTGMDVVIIGRTPDQVPLEFREKYPSIKIISDDLPGAGPMGGLLTAFTNFGACEAVALLPCDAPGITKDAIDWLCAWGAAHIKARCKQAVVPVYAGRFEPLFAVYARSVYDDAQSYLAAVRKSDKSASMKGLLKLIDCEFVGLPAAHQCAVQDVDTPEQLAENEQSTS